MALEIPLWKNNLDQKSILFLGPSIWNESNNDLRVLYTANSFTHNYEKLTLKFFECVEHNLNHIFHYYYHC